MQTLVYRRARSDSANLLAAALKGRRVRGRDGVKFWRKKDRFVTTVRPGDLVVCWGEYFPPIEGVKVLNNIPQRDKLEDAAVLEMAGIPTIQASEEERRGWLPRRDNHIGGHDLLNPPAEPDYWVKREQIREEYRIHCFDGKSIRAGVKVHRDGYEPHEWIRSLDAGWRIRYDGFHSKRPMRELAAAACTALGLDFGAVDLALLENGKFIVLEVNRAPGLEGNTITAYANAITRWKDEQA